MMGIDPTRLTQRRLNWLLEGHELQTYAIRSLLAGIFNRLGDGSTEPYEVEPPAWYTRQQLADARADVASARLVFEAAFPRGGASS